MNSRLKINIHSGDVEFEGSENFVNEQIHNLHETIKFIRQSAAKTSPASIPPPKANPAEENQADQHHAGEPDDIPESFGEWMHAFTASISEQDKALVAGMFVQKSSEKNDFKTSEINGVLKDHGFKLSNPSKSLNDLVLKKLVFQTRKEGKLKFLRVSKPGEARIAELRAGDS
ncbi:MAG: hypothetical protein PF483_07255 [Halothiobacillus sp.]|jgi:hypothetical protein|nr:hypothetical protein [Halothiobacillus sp.]